MSLYISVILATLSYSSSASDIDVCTSTFTGSSGELCNGYGFCSSCVSNGCSWCELTSRCVNLNSACTKHEMFGLTSIQNCTDEYLNNNRERPDIYTTSYDPELSAIMSLYAKFAKNQEYEHVAQYSTFTLIEESIQNFTAKVTVIESDQCEEATAIDELVGAILDVFGLPTFHELMYELYQILYLGDPDNMATTWENAGIQLTSIISEVAKIDIDMDTVYDLVAQLDVSFDDLGEHRVVVGRDDVNEAIVVSFRGTDNFEQGLGYIRHCLINWDKSDITQLKSDLDVSHDVYVMEIISTAYDELKEEFYSYVQQLIEDYPEYQLFITGHSLGGALANIFVLDLYTDYYNNGQALDKTKIKVYTYAQPRVGNDGFATLVNTVLDYEYYRVVLGKDPVTAIPPWLFGFRHSGIEIHYGVGDFVNDTACQYRECTLLDPYEDTSCRKRYHDADWDDPLAVVQEIIDIFSDGALGNYYYEDTVYGFTNIHRSANYANLGKIGHCGAYNTSVKCTDRTSYLDIDIADYRCVNPLGSDQSLQGVTNALSTVYSDGAFDTINGCPDDMHCCLGTLRSGSICVEAEGLSLTCAQTNIGEHCLKSDDCQDTLFNTVSCVDGICEDDGTDLGDSCFWDHECKGFNLLGAGVSCCWFKCTEKQENYLGLFVCPQRCKKTFWSWWGTCNYEYDGTCSEFSETTNDCSEVEDGWNLGIGIGDHKYAGTNARIMFSYCIDRICSDWYRLDHCYHDDFYGSCRYEYFIVPNMTEIIQTALESSADVSIDFEFATCGSRSNDGLQIDQIGIGHEAFLITIDTFEHADDAFCRFSGTDEHSFVVDSDICNTVSLSYNLGTTSSNIYSGLISSRCYDEICDNAPSCASESSDCVVHGLSESNTPIINNPEVNVLQFEISNRMLWVMGGFMAILLLISMNNISKCRRNKDIKYHIVNVESSSEDC